MGIALAWQGSLLDGGQPGVDGAFAAVRRHRLDDCCWVDHAPGWLAGSDSLFDELLAGCDWRSREVPMFGRRVVEPRLVTGYEPGVPLPPAVAGIVRALSTRYSVEFDSVWINLYRNGRDSVAWHGDRVRHLMSEPLVATVSLGAVRRFGLRPRGAGARRSFALGPGDLVVMGGRSQHDWEHSVPKVAAAGPRMSITVRHSRPARSVATASS
jgi:alkylated DNA repair dioxygenase AlkB